MEFLENQRMSNEKDRKAFNCPNNVLSTKNMSLCDSKYSFGQVLSSLVKNHLDIVDEEKNVEDEADLETKIMFNFDKLEHMFKQHDDIRMKIANVPKSTELKIADFSDKMNKTYKNCLNMVGKMGTCLKELYGKKYLATPGSFAALEIKK